MSTLVKTYVASLCFALLGDLGEPLDGGILVARLVPGRARACGSTRPAPWRARALSGSRAASAPRPAASSSHSSGSQPEAGSKTTRSNLRFDARRELARPRPCWGESERTRAGRRRRRWWPRAPWRRPRASSAPSRRPCRRENPLARPRAGRAGRTETPRAPRGASDEWCPDRGARCASPAPRRT